MKASLLLISVAFLVLSIIPVYAQPVAVSDLPVGSRLVYRLEGVYLGNKTYEVMGWSSSAGRKCKLVKISLQVNASSRYFYRGINSTSYFCYDERGRPLSENLSIPPEFNLSVRRVNIYYWWSDDEVYPYKTLIQMVGKENSSYEILLKKGLVISVKGNIKKENKVNKRNLSKVLPFLPERLSEPYVDISSLKLKEGYRKSYGSLNISVISFENVKTPAGLFPCYKVNLNGLTEDQLSYNSIVYLSSNEPRVTVQYETDITGIKQWGYLIEMDLPTRSNQTNIWIYLVLLLTIVVIISSIITKKKRKK